MNTNVKRIAGLATILPASIIMLFATACSSNKKDSANGTDNSSMAGRRGIQIENFETVPNEPGVHDPSAPMPDNTDPAVGTMPDDNSMTGSGVKGNTAGKKPNTNPNATPVAPMEKGVTASAAFDGNFKDYLESRVGYPEDAENEGDQGVVVIRFTVNEQGQVMNVMADPRSPVKDGELVDEAIRVVQSSNGKWKAGMQNGMPVKSVHTQTIRFSLTDS